MSLLTNLIEVWNLETNSNASIDSAHNGVDTGMSYSGGFAVFNGSSSRINVADAANLKPTTSTFTYAIWVKYTASTANMRIFQKYDSTNGWIILTDDGGATGKLKAYVRTASGFTGITSTNAYNDGTLHLVMVVCDGSNINLYVDNVSVATAIAQTGNLTNSSSALRFGVDESDIAGRYAGSAKIGAFWSQALSSNDRAAFYNSGTPVIYPFPVVTSDPMFMGIAF